MSFDGNENHDISLEIASQWTANYGNQNPNNTFAHYFGRKAIEEILAQDGAVGIRIYYALEENNQKQYIITGVTSDENDLYEGKLAEKSQTCPPICGQKNPLNN